MTEETKSHVLDIIAQLSGQYIEIESLARNDAMKDYSNAVMAIDVDARMMAFEEMKRYMEACAEVRKAINILRDAQEESDDRGNQKAPSWHHRANR